jgi:hypothetical protein
MANTEDLSWRVRANFWTGWRAVGGRLTLDSTSLVFRPHAFDRVLGGRGYRTALGDIVSVEVDRRGSVPRKRMFVHTRDGAEAAFLVPHVEERAAEVRRTIPGGHDPRS